MSLRSVQRQAAQRYVELGTDLSASLRPQRLKHVTSDLPTTARLLRNSRLFSLPPPIPSPSSQLNASTRTSNESNTATAPFPTRAAIITPRSSLAKGDWGLKRPLPDKALKTTTPVIRLKANDTIDHITEFESASDHVFTLQKWQELDMPITIPRANYFSLGRYHSDGPLSAFDDSQDPKEIPTEFKEDQADERGWGVSGVGQNRKTATRRWKYTSPWIAGMPAGEFEDYVRTTIKKRRVEFRAWLRQRLAERRTSTTASESSKSGGLFLEGGLSDSTADEASLEASVDEIIDEVTGDKTAAATADAVNETPSTEDTAADDILRLRSRQMDLFEHIWAFLDLPGRLPNASSDLNTYSGQLLDINQGPPQTHPSAGLSYLRPGPFLHNHAALGPMAQPPPVAARVLQRPEGPRKAMLGVAGIAVDRSWAADGREAEWRVSAIANKGGPKAHVLPQGAHVDSHGRIHLDVRKAQADQVAAWVGEAGEEGGAAGGTIAPRSSNGESADSVFGSDSGNASGSASLDSILMARRPAAAASSSAAPRVPDLAALAKGAAAAGAAGKEE